MRIRDLTVSCIHATTNQNVVGLDVGMDDIALLEEGERKEQLLRVGAHRLDGDADVLAVLLEHLTEIHAARQNSHGSRLPERFKHHAQVTAELEVGLDAHNVAFVLGVCVVELLEDLNLLEPKAVPGC